MHSGLTDQFTHTHTHTHKISCTLYLELHKRFCQTHRQEIISQYKRQHISILTGNYEIGAAQCTRHGNARQITSILAKKMFIRMSCDIWKRLARATSWFFLPTGCPRWGAAQAMLSLIWIVYRREELKKRLLFVCMKTLFSLVQAVKDPGGNSVWRTPSDGNP